MKKSQILDKFRYELQSEVDEVLKYYNINNISKSCEHYLNAYSVKRKYEKYKSLKGEDYLKVYFDVLTQINDSIAFELNTYLRKNENS